MDAPYKRAIAVTPSDTVDIGNASGKFLSDAVLVKGTGNIVLVLENGETLQLDGVAANTILPFMVRRVNATNTTATGIFALKRF